jgi:uroporphyrinogen III methyltransferase/synthase
VPNWAAGCSIKARANLSAVNPSDGKVYLVGAGPGAPDLITIRGAAVMRRAEVVVYDFLVSPEMVKLAPAGAELIFAGKKGGAESSFDQVEINRLLVDRARDGRLVVRLKGGDPFIFGRGGEEAQALAAAGIAFEVVPGVTSAIAAPAFAGIPLTHREHGSFVAFLTGHEDLAKNPAAARTWDEIARAARGRGTIVILMATARMGPNLARLIAAGLAADTPAAAIQWGATAAQKTVSATLGTLAAEVDRAGLGAPAVVVIGQCAGLRTDLRWFEQMPLFGRRIVVTRAAGNAERFAAKLRTLGAETIEFPTIVIAPPSSFATLDDALARLAAFDWIIFTSATGVDAFVQRIRALGRDLRELGATSIAAIGPATADRLSRFALKTAAMPTEFRAEAVIGAIGEQKISGARILIPRAQVAREILPETLREKGAREVVVAPAYRTIRPSGADSARIRELANAGMIDLVAFTSSSTVTNFCELLQPPPRGLKAAVIGPITGETARQHGLEVAVCPGRYTSDALIAAIVEYLHPRC